MQEWSAALSCWQRPWLSVASICSSIASAAVLGEVGLQDAAVAGMRVPGHPSLVLKVAQDLVHGLGDGGVALG